jgi:predicted ATPase/DNA-binding SARP family transcriptional activator
VVSGIRLDVLGPLEVTVDREAVDIRRGIPRAILVALVVRAREVVSAGTLAELVWADAQPRNPVNALQLQVSYLRKRLGGGSAGQPVVTRPGGYVLMVDDDDIDARRFERLVRDATQLASIDPLASADMFETALGLWRGAAFADVLGEPFVIGEATRLEEMRLTALEERNEVLLTLGRHAELVGELTGLVNEHPLRERFQAQLVLALYRSGRQADALRAFARARSTLVDELGIDPGPDLRRLEQQILNQDPELDWRSTVTEHPVDVSVSNVSLHAPPAVSVRAVAQLPKPVTALVGRQAETAKVRQLLGRSRVVTLTGPGGGGKSRLALEVAHEVLSGVGDEVDRPVSDVWYVDLGSVDDSEQVAAVVAGSLGIPTVPGEDAAVAVAATLAARSGLLVLDTCEHVVAGAASLVGQVLRDAGDVVVLATSQRPLGVNGEIAWPVPPLALAPPDIASVTDALSYPAVALFVDRAVAVRPDFELTESNLGDVVAICLALDGLPLAIELAAARSDMLSPGAIRQRLEHRFDLLVDGARDLAPRQQTLRAAVDWSAELLDDQHRRFFARLAVFPATFDLDAAAAVAAEPSGDDAFRMLTDLVRQSMVTVPGPDRFRLLDTLRAYAAELLADADADATSHRHAQHYLELAERGEDGIRGPDQLHWLELLRAAVPQHRAALEWMLSTGDTEGAARLAGALGWFWVVDGMLADAHHHLGQIVDLPGLSDRVRAKASWTLALVAASLGDLQRCQTLGALAADLGRAVGDDAIIGHGLNAEAVALWGSGQLAQSAVLHEEAVRHSEAAGDVWGTGVCTVLRARTAVDAGDPNALEMTQHAVEAARRTGDAHIVGIALEQCARVALNNGDPTGALALLEESLAGHEAIGYSEGILASLHLLGRAELANGDPIAARERHLRALGIAVGIGHAAGTIEALDGLAAVAVALGDAPLASRLALVVEAERAARHLPRRADECAMFENIVAEAATPTPGSGVPTLAALADEILRSTP